MNLQMTIQTSTSLWKMQFHESDILLYIKDAEFVSETVVINRLYHRELIARMPKIEELEKKWNCKIDFPSTETASDVVTISGPEYQVPQALDEFLVCVLLSCLLLPLNSNRAWFQKPMKLCFQEPSLYEISSRVKNLSWRFAVSW